MEHLKRMDGASFFMPVGLYEKALPAELCWEERLNTAREAGYDFLDISIDVTQARLARLERSSSERAVIRRAIANTGVPILTMCLSAHRENPLGSHSPEIRNRGLDIFRKAIDFATDIGLRIVQVMGYDVFSEPSDEGTKARFLDGLLQGVLWAAQAGVMLGLENVDVPYLESVEKGLKLVREIDSPWFHLYSDMGNLAAAGYHPPDEIRRAKGELVAVHVKDSMPQIIRGIPFETGIVPLEETFKALAEIEFWGILTVEMWADMDNTGDPLASVIHARKLVNRLVSSAWQDPTQ
jgi:L-ribulose-5-phosphate 3-epimerase